MVACPNCNAESPDGARFCAYCATPLTAASPTREERKVVSVVFVDLVGHTARSDAADPEDVRSRLASYYATVRGELEKFGGTVEKFIGDAVMAVFGAPVAHEDDPERAVRAALAARDAMADAGLEVRVAVNTGEALVALDARPELGEALVAGDVVNTAARLQSAAPVGGVLVGEVTHRATTRAIDYGELVSVDAKGKSEPLRAWIAVEPRARFGVDVRQHGGAPLVGREAELRFLIDAFERARRERVLQVVTLIGVPGIGKSRLVWELFQHLDREPDLTWWRQGRALAYGGGAFGALAEAVRSQIGVLEGEGADEIAPKLGRALDELPLDADDCGWLVRRLEPLLGIATSEPPQRGEAFAAWQRLLEAMASVRPFVLVLEDLHWADDGTLDFLDHLADWSSDVPLLVVATARPELLERRPDWGGGKLNTHTLALRPLDERSTAQLLGRLLDAPVIEADLQARLLQQAGGNPLYAEEFARMVSEAGSETAVPDSVQGIIAARIDVLEAREKALLQDAAVLGKVFWRGGLLALGAEDADLDDALRRLARKEFIRRESGSIVGEDAEFAFRHALVRDVAYAQLPRAARAAKHRLAAEWIAATTVARPDLVAHHYVQALELQQLAGTEPDGLLELTRDALRAAGERSRSLAAYDDAAALFERALELAPDPGPVRAALFLDLTRTADLGGKADDTRARGEAARELYRALGDQARLSEVEAILARATWALGDGAEAQKGSARAVEAAVASGDERALAYARSTQARLLSVSGRPDEAIAPGEEAVALADKLGLDDVSVASALALVTARAFLDVEGWRTEYDRVIERARALNLPELLGRALNNRANHEFKFLGPRAAEEWYAEMARVGFRYRLPFGLRWTEATLTWTEYVAGRWDAALEYGESFFAREAGLPHYLDAQVLQARALIEFARGRDRDALAAGDEALARARQVGEAQQLGPVLTWRALQLAELGQLSEAHACLSETIQLGGALEEAFDYATAPAWVALRLGVELPEETYVSFWAKAGRAITARRFEDAIAMLDAAGAPTEAAYARLALAKGLVDEGRDPEPWLSEADAFYRGVDAVRYVLELDELRLRRRSA